MLNSRAQRLYSLTHGGGSGAQVIEGLDVPVDFSNGDQVIAAPDGYVVKSATIKKPANLIPENIAKDVNIAGVVGTYAGGGSGSMEGCPVVTFMNGTEVLFQRPVYSGDDCPDPVSQGRLVTPTKESTAQYDYTYSGWATTNGGSASGTALTNITEDKTVYAAYTSTTRRYTIRFFDGDVLLETLSVAYYSMPKPTTPIHSDPSYAFDAWSPALTSCKGDADYYATWTVKMLFKHYTWDEIAAFAADGTASERFSIGDEKPISFTELNVYGNPTGAMATTTAKIIGFSHDDKADGSGKAGITLWVTGGIYSHTGTHTPGINTKPYGWENSKRRETLATVILPLLDPALSAVISPVSKKWGYSNLLNTYTEHGTTTDSLWELSLEELGYGSQGPEAGSRYAAFTTSKSVGLNKDYADISIGKTYYTRSYYGFNEAYYINDKGHQNSRKTSDPYYYFCFCI